MMKVVELGLLLATLMAPADAALAPVIVKGNKLFDAQTRSRFYMHGITYGYETEVSYKSIWKKNLDTVKAQNPHINTVRIYRVDPLNTAEQPNNYDDFMQYMQDNNMYVLVPLTPSGDEPWSGCTLNRNNPPEPFDNPGGTCYPSCLLSYAHSVMNIFGKYTNTLAYVIGNEVIMHEKLITAKCLRAFTRDVKDYMLSCENQRVVPTMYTAADTPVDKKDTSDRLIEENDANGLKNTVLTCGAHSDRVDMFGLNIYRWCGTDVSTGYDNMNTGLVNHATTLDGQKTNIVVNGPLVLSEFGCDNFFPRPWTQIGYLFTTMRENWSGGTAYAYSSSGGMGYAMFTNEGHMMVADHKADPGNIKNCYATDKQGGIVADGSCDADNYKNQLGAALAEIGAPESLPDGDLCDVMPFEAPAPYASECPSVPTYFTSAELKTLPVSRERNYGYKAITCPATLPTLSALDRTIKGCYLPKGEGSYCSAHKHCARCEFTENSFPGWPLCAEKLKWLSESPDQWFGALKAQIGDGSLCTIQKYLSIPPEKHCPPVDERFKCDGAGFCRCERPGVCLDSTKTDETSCTGGGSKWWLAGCDSQAVVDGPHTTTSNTFKIHYDEGSYLCYSTDGADAGCTGAKGCTAGNFVKVNTQAESFVELTLYGEQTIKYQVCHDVYGNAEKQTLSLTLPSPPTPPTSPTGAPTTLAPTTASPTNAPTAPTMPTPPTTQPTNEPTNAPTTGAPTTTAPSVSPTKFVPNATNPFGPTTSAASTVQPIAWALGALALCWQ